MPLHFLFRPHRFIILVFACLLFSALGSAGQAAGSPMSFDDFLKDPKNQAEFDRRVGKALETNRSKMQAELNTKVQEAVTEAESSAKNCKFMGIAQCARPKILLTP